MKKIGIYSGTFDPVHNGHIAFVLEAIEQNRLDKVYFLPEPRPRRKQGVKAFEHRTAMVSIAIEPYDKLGMIILEQARFTPERTLPVLLERFRGAKLCMLMGDDMLDHFVTWRGVENLMSSLSFVIGLRKYDAKHVEEIANTLKSASGHRLKYETFAPTQYKISSSSIKKNIKSKLEFNDIDPNVAEYIIENKLYISDGAK
jgi:nicotinate-nucleotide adenylyltransferase